MSDQQGLFGILDNSIDCFPRLSKIWADSGYQGEYAKNYCSDFGLNLEIMKRSDQKAGFKVVPGKVGSRENICVAGQAAPVYQKIMNIFQALP